MVLGKKDAKLRKVNVMRLHGQEPWYLLFRFAKHFKAPPTAPKAKNSEELRFVEDQGFSTFSFLSKDSKQVTFGIQGSIGHIGGTD